MWSRGPAPLASPQAAFATLTRPDNEFPSSWGKISSHDPSGQLNSKRPGRGTPAPSHNQGRHQGQPCSEYQPVINLLGQRSPVAQPVMALWTPLDLDPTPVPYSAWQVAKPTAHLAPTSRCLIDIAAKKIPLSSLHNACRRGRRPSQVKGKSSPTTRVPTMSGSRALPPDQ